MSARPSTRPPRRRFRTSLRGLMILVLVVGGGMGWMSWKISRVRVQRAVVARLQAAGATVLYDYQFATDPAAMKRLAQVAEPTAPRWLRRWVGDDYFRTAVCVRLRSVAARELLPEVARLDGLVSLRFDATWEDGFAWHELARLTRLAEVHLIGSGVTDSALLALGQLESLRSIRLVRTAATDGGLRHLARLPALRSLAIGGSLALSDAGVARLLADGLPLLEEFSYGQAGRSIPATIRALADHQHGLRKLVLIQVPVADADLAPIGALTSLTLLNLQQTLVTDAGLADLRPLVRLESLVISLPGITDAGMKSVGRLRNLRLLDLAFSQVGDPGLAELAGLTRLTDLRLRSTRVTDASAAVLGRFVALETLLLNDTRVTDATLDHLGKLQQLRLLGLGRTGVTPAATARLRAILPGLR